MSEAISDDVCMYDRLAELEAENKSLLKELMFMEAERDEYYECWQQELNR